MVHKSKKRTDPNGGEVIIYKGANKNPKLEVRLQNESVWLTQKQMAELFDKDVRTINDHVRNVFREGELKSVATIRKFRIVQTEAGRRVVRDVECYNLDVIISVGYRVKSLRGTQFRIWATNVLRQHIIDGYTINQKRLEEHQSHLLSLQKAIAFIRSKATRPGLVGQTDELMSVVQDYTHTLTLLHQYDKGALTLQRGKKARSLLTYENIRALIDTTKEKLLAKKEASDLFGVEYGGKLKSILGAIYQTFGGAELYSTIEEKAAHVLYLVIKDHPFSDGNKRIGSLLFVYFLEKNKYLWRKNGERKISDTTLVALALLIAESDPKEKEIMIALITNLLV